MPPSISFPQPAPDPVQHSFAQAPVADIERSTFSLSHAIKLTCDCSYLIPFYTDEILPSETRSAQFQFFGRLGTPLYAPMDNLYVDTFFFFVPYRLLWDNWPKLCGEQRNPGDSIAYTTPKVVKGSMGAFTFALHSLGDYFGHPTEVPITPNEINAWQWRAYALTYNKWFRDENLQNEVPFNTGDGPDNLDATVTVNNTLLRRGRRKDYFTSALPWPQKGDDILLPLGDTAPVFGEIPDLNVVGRLNNAAVESDSFLWHFAGGGSQGTQDGIFTAGAPHYGDQAGTMHTNAFNLAGNEMWADLSEASAANINDFRLAVQLQRLLERDARSGTRYPEILRAHFGVIDPMLAVLQFPQYLGGGETPITTVPVPQVSNTSGQPAGMGTIGSYQVVSGRHGHGFTYSATEHGILLGIMSIRADQTYSQGLNRKWCRSTRYDYYMPVLAHLGEQTVLNKEIYYDSTDGHNDEVFGYQEHWAEYRYTTSQLMGLMRPQATGSLAVWHYGQHYTARPALNDGFIQDNTAENVDRTIAVPSQPQIIMDIWVNERGAKPMPVFSVPGLVDHF